MDEMQRIEQNIQYLLDKMGKTWSWLGKQLGYKYPDSTKLYLINRASVHKLVKVAEILGVNMCDLLCELHVDEEVRIINELKSMANANLAIAQAYLEEIKERGKLTTAIVKVAIELGLM